jgi:hypothetical protein
MGYSIPDDRELWRRYACAALSGIGETGPAHEVASYAGDIADAMMSEDRRRREDRTSQPPLEPTAHGREEA